jgi:hypothetical protein
MIYEVRTYTLRPGTLAEFEERYEKRLPLRFKHSPLGYARGSVVRIRASTPIGVIERRC